MFHGWVIQVAAAIVLSAMATMTVGCEQDPPPADSRDLGRPAVPQAPVHRPVRHDLTLEDFQHLRPGMGSREVFRHVGQPRRNIGIDAFVGEYVLEDGRRVYVSFPDGLLHVSYQGRDLLAEPSGPRRSN
jgi:hypothetical protein